MKNIVALGALTLTGLVAAVPAHADDHSVLGAVAPATAGPLAALGNWQPSTSGIHYQQLAHLTPQQAGDAHTVTNSLGTLTPLG